MALEAAWDAEETLAGWLDYIGHTFAADYQDGARRYVEVLLARGLPVVFDMPHLACRVGLPIELLRALISKPDRFYRSFRIPKRRGGTREIRAPYAAAAAVQYWVSRYILLKIPVSECAHGFVQGRSIVTNATQHLGARAVLRIDIKDFFPTIGLPRVLSLFQSLGYNTRASYALARACLLDNKLPQGAPTSPTIANLVVHRMDRRLAALAATADLSYSRYADDLVFSGKSISNTFGSIVSQVIRSEGFELNPDKTYLSRGASRRVVTGVSVSMPYPRLPRNKRRDLRAQVHQVFANPSGRSPRENGRRLPTDPQRLQRLLGSLAHWVQVEPTSKFATEAHSKLLTLIAELSESTSASLKLGSSNNDSA
jgi:hypothetical protein